MINSQNWFTGWEEGLCCNKLCNSRGFR